MKKIKNKIVKKVNKIKQYLKDQSFYLKTGLLAVKDTAALVLGMTVLGLFVVFCSLAADKFHMLYMDQHIGKNSLMVKNPEGATIRGSGTGFEVQAKSGKVYTITNAHVCALAKDGIIMVELESNSERFIPRRVLEVYEKNDLCLIEGIEGYTGLKLASDYSLGEPVWAIGYPMGDSMNVSNGRIKSRSLVELIAEDTLPANCNKPGMQMRSFDTFFGSMQICTIQRRAIMTDVQIFPGNSGSPLVNIYGNVVGVVFASDTRTHWGSAVPLADLKELLEAY